VVVTQTANTPKGKGRWFFLHQREKGGRNLANLVRPVKKGGGAFLITKGKKKGNVLGSEGVKRRDGEVLFFSEKRGNIDLLTKGEKKGEGPIPQLHLRHILKRQIFRRKTTTRSGGEENGFFPAYAEIKKLSLEKRGKDIYRKKGIAKKHEFPGGVFWVKEEKQILSGARRKISPNRGGEGKGERSPDSDFYLKTRMKTRDSDTKKERN